MDNTILESCVKAVAVKDCSFLTAILAASTVLPPVSSKSNLREAIPVVSAASLSFLRTRATNSPSVSCVDTVDALPTGLNVIFSQELPVK